MGEDTQPCVIGFVYEYFDMFDDVGAFVRQVEDRLRVPGKATAQ